MSGKRQSSADRLRELLSHHEAAFYAGMNDALYHAQIQYTCDLLDVVDQAADEATAVLITSLIYERLAGKGALEGAERISDRSAKMKELMAWSQPRLRIPPRA